MSVRGSSPKLPQVPASRSPKPLVGEGAGKDDEKAADTRLDDVPLRAGLNARKAAEDTRDRFDSDFAFLSGPSRPSVSKREEGGGVEFGGRDLSGSITHASDELSTTAAGGFSSSGLWTRLSRADGSTSVRVGSSLSESWIGGSGGIAWANLDGDVTSVTGGAAWYPGGIALDGSVGRTRKNGVTVGLGAMGLFDADRVVKDLGPAPNDSGKRRIELKRSLGSSGTLSPGVAAELLGVGLRLGAGRKRTVVYRTTVSDEDARALVHKRKGVVAWARNKARATGAAEDPIRIPDVRAPETFSVGDELITTVTGRFKTGLFIGGLPLRLGAQGMMQGEFQLGVRRLDEHRYEVVVTPTDIKGIQGRLGAPWIIEGDLGSAECKGLTQGFVFDLREPDARQAYEAVFDGELPGGLPNKVKGRRREVGELARALEEEALPPGVQRSFVDQVELVRAHKGVSASFGLWFKGGSYAGLGYESAKVNESRVRLDRDATITTDTRGVEQRKQVLLSGEEGRGVYASIKRRTTFDAAGDATSHFDGLKLSLELSDSRVRGRELDDEMIAALNEGLGLSLPESGRDGRNKTRHITVTRELSAEDLERLSAENAPELASLKPRLQGASVEERALAVQAFIAEGGLEAMGAVVRALGSAVVIDTTSSAYDEPVESARSFSLRYPKPISADDDIREVVQRFHEGTKVLRDAKLGLVDLEHDPLLDDKERGELRKKLQGAHAEAERVLDVTHLSADERAAMVARLERGWVTGKKQRVIDALSS